MKFERVHCQSCGTEEGEFESWDVEGIPMTLCADCRVALDREVRGDEERRGDGERRKRDRREVSDRRFIGSTRRRHERRR